LFPGTTSTSATNGIVNISIAKNNIEKGMDQPMAFLVGFRQFVGYHLEGVKITMHTRMRTKTDTIENMIRQARKDEEA